MPAPKKFRVLQKQVLIINKTTEIKQNMYFTSRIKIVCVQYI